MDWRWKTIERRASNLVTTKELQQPPGETSKAVRGAALRSKRDFIAALLLVAVPALTQSVPAQTVPGEAQQFKPQAPVSYRIGNISDNPRKHLQGFDSRQMSILEKLNRADRAHLPRLREIVIPEQWDRSELAYSPLPHAFPWALSRAKVIIVHQPWQVFGAYEYGRLVRWGPVSTGQRRHRTPSGYFHLNWRSKGRHSTVNPQWYMPWYFNFDNLRGLSFHAYVLPGYPASHACVRLLDRDARWLYQWGEPWKLDAQRQTIVETGTPVLIVGRYDFTAPTPWRSPERLSQPLNLPAGPER